MRWHGGFCPSSSSPSCWFPPGPFPVRVPPQKHDREAAAEFDQAIAQFELELKQQPSSAVAHNYLGRIYSLRKDYRKWAEHYDRLSEIEPLNVDAYTKTVTTK